MRRNSFLPFSEFLFPAVWSASSQDSGNFLFCQGILCPLPTGMWPLLILWKWTLFSSLQPPGLHSPWNSPGQNTGVGSHSFLQGIFPTQGLNPDLLHWRWILYQLSHKGSPRILQWVTYPFSSGSFWPRNQTRVSCIAGKFFTNWAMREADLPILWAGVTPKSTIAHLSYKDLQRAPLGCFWMYASFLC